MDSCTKCFRLIEQGFVMDQCCYQMICQNCVKDENIEGKIFKCLLCKKKINYEIPQFVKQILCKQHDQLISFKKNKNFYCEVCIFETNDNNDENLIQIDQEDIYDDLKTIRNYFKALVLENQYKTVDYLIEKQIIYFNEIQKFIDKIHNKYTIEGLKYFHIQQKKKKNHFDPINLQKFSLQTNEYKKKDDSQNQLIQINQVYNYQKSKVVNKQKIKNKGLKDCKQSQQLQEQGQKINKQKQYIQDLKLNLEQQTDQIQQQLLEIETLKNQITQKSSIQRTSVKIDFEKSKQDRTNNQQMQTQIDQQKQLISLQQQKIDQQKKQLEYLRKNDNKMIKNDSSNDLKKLNNQLIQLKQEKQILEEKIRKQNNSELPSMANKFLSVFKKSESQNKIHTNDQITLNQSRMNQSILRNRSGNTTARNKTKDMNLFQKIYMKMKGQKTERPKSKVTISEPNMNKNLNSSSRSIYGNNWLIGKSHVEKLKQWLNKSDLKLNLIYKGSLDGFTAQSFYQKCENKKQTIIVIKSQNNEMFGGYADIAWRKTNTLWIEGYGNSFVFSFTKNSKHPCKDKRYELSGNQYYFAKFGYDIAISDQCNLNAKSYSNIGCKYQVPQGLQVNSDEAKKYMAGSYLFKVTEIETYQIQQ